MTMAPSAELKPRLNRDHNYNNNSKYIMANNNINNMPYDISNHLRKPGNDRKTVAYAVNYERNMVDRYLAGGPSSSRKPAPSSSDDASEGNSQAENNAPNDNTSSPPLVVEEEEGGPSIAKRRSTREPKQRALPKTPVKVRYDMESVPSVERPKLSFWNDVKVWPPRALKDPPPPIMASSTIAEPRPPDETPKAPTTVPPMPKSNENSPLPHSVIWKPPTRKDWEDSVSELVAVCTSAALRKHSGKSSKFTPPLSKEYIRDRIDIDDPMNGYQIRHEIGGWLQGFCLWTNFTTWTHYFTWDSLHPKSGLSSMDYIKDTDGSLAMELQSLPRSGDPSDSGIVFDHVAEIALLGGLGCGELLLRMALEEILKSGRYKYVVLQATKGSRPFYERFGFQRVGAICRYAGDGAVNGDDKNGAVNGATAKGKEDEGDDRSADALKEESQGEASEQDVSHTTNSSPWAVPTMDDPIQGYRHWTHANESQHSLDLHGGPSYMMCLKLPDEPVEGLNLLDTLAPCFVTEKPTIELIGSVTTPTSKRKLKRQLSAGNTPPMPHMGRGGSPALSSSSPSEDWNNKRRKVSMDKLDLNDHHTMGSAAAGYYPIPQSTYSSSSTPPPPLPPSSSRLRNSKAYNQLLAKAAANTTASKANKTPTKTMISRSSKAKTSLSPKKVEPQGLEAAATPGPTTANQQAVPQKGIQKIDRSTLVKQKVKSYPRDREHFYNKVVQPKNATNGPYYFVLHYNDKANMVTLCPMAPKGVLSGKRQGRPRYQCLVQPTNANWITAPARLYEAVPAFMVMKTPLVAQEAWDVLAEE